VLVHGVHNPVDSWVLANNGVLWVHQDDLKILVGRVLHRKDFAVRILS
jgi:hypothetical protein